MFNLRRNELDNPLTGWGGGVGAREMGRLLDDQNDENEFEKKERKKKWISTWLLGGEFHALLLLALVAEPDADDVLLEIQLFRNGRYLLAGWPGLNGEIGLQRALLRSCDARPLPLLLAGRQDGRCFRIPPLVPRLSLGLFQPRVKDRLQSDHVVVRQRERFKPAFNPSSSASPLTSFSVFTHYRPY